MPDLLNTTFHIVDTKLSQLAAEDGTHSGCTAVTAFLRLENADGTPWARVGGGVADKEVGRLKGAAGAGPDGDLLEASGINRAMKEGQATGHTATQGGQEADTSGGGLEKEAMKQAIGELGKAAERREESLQSEGSGSANEAGSASAVGGKRPDSPAKRTLYTANVGDARAVLSCVLPLSPVPLPESMAQAFALLQSRWKGGPAHVRPQGVGRPGGETDHRRRRLRDEQPGQRSVHPTGTW